MTQAGDHTEDDIALIGEYALHLLDADSRLAVERRLRDEPGLRDLLREWDEGLVHLAHEIEEVTPPAQIKPAIDARLFGQNQAPTAKGFSFGRVSGWLGGAAMLAAALAFAIYFAPSFLQGPDGPVYVAEIAAEDRGLVVQARYDPVSGEIEIDRTTGVAATGRVLELWLIAEGATAPVSLGVLPTDPQARLEVAEALRSGMIGGTLAISDEPPGGSPTGAPTGAVLAVGPVVLS